MLPSDTDDSLKRYYSIGEVAEMFGVSKSLIRFWESEFDFLRPHKNSKGDRRFTPQNIEQFRLIYHLVKERGFTLEGARQEIDHRRGAEKERQACLDRLHEVKAFFLTLRERYAEPEPDPEK